jgi:hypothetical protein
MKKESTYLKIKDSCKRSLHYSIYMSLVIIMSALNISSCKKDFLEVDPPINRLVSESVFENDDSATSAVAGIYSTMMQIQAFLSSNSAWFAGLCSDELNVPSNSASQLPYLRNEIPVDNADMASMWTQAYQYIYYANSAIEGIGQSKKMSTKVSNQLMGEVKFTRALTYFYLVNLYGGVPKITSTDYKVNTILARASESEIYAQIIQDLRDAKELLPAAYTTTERVRPNKYTATALLARACLHTKDWSGAESMATEIISSGVYSLSTLPNTFLKSSNETIWQIMPVATGFNTFVASRFLPANATTAPNYTLTPDMAASFESNDQRRSNWVGTVTAAGITYSYANKYKIRAGNVPLNEYYIVFRLAEQYLIRAEARAHLQQDQSLAVADINTVRSRASLPGLSTTLTQIQSLLAIEKERRSELFAEWGLRWLDLKRTGRVDAVMSVVKPSTWKSTAALWPIPVTQISINPKLVQNPGY